MTSDWTWKEVETGVGYGKRLTNGIYYKGVKVLEIADMWLPPATEGDGPHDLSDLGFDQIAQKVVDALNAGWLPPRN